MLFNLLAPLSDELNPLNVSPVVMAMNRWFAPPRGRPTRTARGAMISEPYALGLRDQWE